MVGKQNLIYQSQALATAPWTSGGTATLTNNYAEAPNRTMTASRVQWSATGTKTVYSTTIAHPDSKPMCSRKYTLSAWMRGTSSAVTLRFRVPLITTVSNQYYNISLTTTWQRISFTFDVIGEAANWGSGWVLITNDVAETAADFLVWGVQLVEANWAGEYCPTTTALIDLAVPKNISPKSQNLMASSDINNSTVNSALDSGALTTGPTGQNDARILRETAVDTYHFRAMDVTAVPSTRRSSIYTASIDIKADGRDWVVVGDLNLCAAFFNVTTGVRGNKYSAGTDIIDWRISPIGNGFYRCQVVGPLRPDGSYCGVLTSLTNTTTTENHLGDITKGIIVANCSLALGNVFDVHATSGTADPVDMVCRNLSPKSQNLALYSDIESWGNAVGTKNGVGTLVNGWRGFVEDGSTGPHARSTSLTANPRTRVRQIDIKAGTRSYAMINSATNLGQYVWINLTTGAITPIGSTWTVSATPDGTGWRLKETSAYTGGSATSSMLVYAATGIGTSSYTGVDGDTAIWVANNICISMDNPIDTHITTGVADKITEVPKNLITKTQNLTLYSETPTIVPWETARITISARTGNFNTCTAVAGTGTKFVYYQTNGGSPSTFRYNYATFSFVLSGATGTATNLWIYAGGTSSWFNFNTVTGIVSGISLCEPNIEYLGGDGYRISMTLPSSIYSYASFWFNGGSTYVSDGVSDVIRLTSLHWYDGPFIPNGRGYIATTSAAIDNGALRTTVPRSQNLFANSDFGGGTGVIWLFNASSAGTLVDGWRGLVEDGTNAIRRTLYAMPISGYEGKKYTVSVDVKAGTKGYVLFLTPYTVSINLSTGIATNPVGGLTRVTRTPDGTGWRVQWVGDVAPANIYISVCPSPDGTTATYQGVNGEVAIWIANLNFSLGDTLGIHTTTGTADPMTTVARSLA
jgi:hypothetical protein